jgi:hypothetical protein
VRASGGGGDETGEERKNFREKEIFFERISFVFSQSL